MTRHNIGYCPETQGQEHGKHHGTLIANSANDGELIGLLFDSSSAAGLFPERPSRTALCVVMKTKKNWRDFDRIPDNHCRKKLMTQTVRFVEDGDKGKRLSGLSKTQILPSMQNMAFARRAVALAGSECLQIAYHCASGSVNVISPLLCEINGDMDAPKYKLVEWNHVIFAYGA
jgi:hypothetical protein